MIDNPFDQIKKSLQGDLPSELTQFLPDKWEKIGDVLTIKFDNNLRKYQEEICKKYAEFLYCKTILNDLGGITGIYRKPKVEIIYGSKNTETIHKENNIQYKLDPTKIMFSSGNMDERKRMGNISNIDEIVVDLFAGIGYFTIPMAVYSRPKKIFACEINPESYSYLCENIVLNNVTAIVEPLMGDNRDTVPGKIANRIIMGYIHNTHKFLPTALNCLKENSGIIHYHDISPDENIPDKSMRVVKKIARKNNREAEIINFRKIKSYAPGISHIVLDIKIFEK